MCATVLGLKLRCSLIPVAELRVESSQDKDQFTQFGVQYVVPRAQSQPSTILAVNLGGAIIPTAFYTGETFKPAPREPLDTVLHIDKW